MNKIVLFTISAIISVCMPSMAQRTLKQEIKKLQQQSSVGVMYGHHDDTMYGYNWSYQDGRSDTYDICGQYPAMMSFELCRIEKGLDKSIDGVPFSLIRREIIRQAERGGSICLSWHADNIVTGRNSWDVKDSTVVSRILNDKATNAEFMIWLDRLADFFLSLRSSDGKPIPVIFRPSHECLGNWFWWGRPYCTPSQYKKLWKITVRHLKKRGVENVIYAYSPGSNTTDEKEYMERYPKNKYVTILGVEAYLNRYDTPDNGWLSYRQRLSSMLDCVAPIAKKKNKVLALTETGMNHKSADGWWTQGLLPVLHNYPIAYMVVWRNKTSSTDDCYGSYPGHITERDFLNFSSDPTIKFCK